MSTELEQLTREGFCIFHNILTPEMLGRLREATDRTLNATTPEMLREMGNQGNIVVMWNQDPAFIELIAWQPALDALRSLGFDRPRYWSGFLIAREPRVPVPLYWHQDWPYWDDPASADPLPHQMFLMYYLTDTTRENGCLRVIPRSHRKRFDLHDVIGQGHESDVRTTTDYSSPVFSEHPDQIDVTARAGDLVVGDARTLHSSHPNQTDKRRTVITMWYLPRFDELSDNLKAAFGLRSVFRGLNLLSEEKTRTIGPLLIDYEGDAKPVPWNRVPSGYLK